MEEPDRPASSSRPNSEDQIEARSPSREYFVGGSRLGPQEVTCYVQRLIEHPLGRVADPILGSRPQVRIDVECRRRLGVPKRALHRHLVTAGCEQPVYSRLLHCLTLPSVDILMNQPTLLTAAREKGEYFGCLRAYNRRRDILLGV